MSKVITKKSVWIDNLDKIVNENKNYREVITTGIKSQLVIMNIPIDKEIGMEKYKDMDQFVKIESGLGLLVYRDGDDYYETDLHNGYGILIPAGTYHNIINRSKKESLKLYSIYSPPEHDDNFIQKEKPKNVKK